MARSLKDTLTRMHRMTYHDGLTGIYNRLGVDRALSTWHETAGERPAVLISLDIDDFKFINDLHGRRGARPPDAADGTTTTLYI